MSQSDYSQSTEFHPENRQEQINTSQAWIHWEYNPDEWDLFERVDWKPVQFRFWLLTALCIPFVCDIIALTGSSLFLAASPAFEDSQMLSLLYPLCGILILPFIVPIIILSSYSYIYKQAKQRHQARQKNQQHRVTIARQGVWEAGIYIPFDVLQEVTMTSQPPVLHFRRHLLLPGGKNAPRNSTFRVLIPHGHEKEAQQLKQRFDTEVIAAREAAWQKANNPPEPV